MGCYCQNRWSAARKAAWTTFWTTLVAWGRVTVSVSSLPASFVYALKQTAFLTLFLDREWTSLPATVHGQRFLRMQWDLEIIFPINVGILSVLLLGGWPHYECTSVAAKSCPEAAFHKPPSHLLVLAFSSPLLQYSLCWVAVPLIKMPSLGLVTGSLSFHALVTYASLLFDCCPLTTEASLTKIESNPGLFVRL